MTPDNFFRKKSNRVYNGLLFTRDATFEECRGSDKKARRKYERLLRKRAIKNEMEGADEWKYITQKHKRILMSY